MRDESTRPRWGRRVIQLVFILLVSAVLSAVIIQDHSGVLPLGLVNAGRKQYAVLSNASLVGCLIALGVFVADAAWGRLRRVAGILRGLIVFVVILEALLTVADSRLANRPNVGLLGGPYRELQTASGTRLVLRKPDGPSPLGFRTDREYALSCDVSRILFLGDSYTEGSGSASPCNYPDVVERAVGERLGRPVEVMNAGVSGYGPEDALRLLRELREMGYRFDGVVYNLLLENDFTDNLPGTERRVAAGMAFRYPQSHFLRVFHPFNTRMVRWGLFAVALIRFERSAHPPTPGRGECATANEPLREVSPLLRGIVMKGLDGNDRAAGSPPAMRQVVDWVDAMRAESDRWGVPFTVVLFPNRALVDTELQEKLELDPRQLVASEALRVFVHESLQGMPVLDATELLAGNTGLYREGDTHLSDVGNVVVGEWVARELLGQIASDDRWTSFR